MMNSKLFNLYSNDFYIPRNCFNSVVCLLFMLTILMAVSTNLYSKGLEVDRDAPRNFSLNQLEEILERRREICRFQIKEYAENHIENIINKKWDKSDLDEFDNKIVIPALMELNSLVQDNSSLREYSKHNIDIAGINQTDKELWINDAINRTIRWLNGINQKYESLVRNLYGSQNYKNPLLTLEQKYKLSLKNIKIERPNEEENNNKICKNIREYIVKIYKRENYSVSYNDMQIFSTESRFSLSHPDVLEKATPECVYEVGKHNNKIYVKCKIHGSEEY